MEGSPRKIIHIDMDAFFAAVEQRDNPRLRNKPIIVGGNPDSRGVVATCSYEARRFGVHSAMPSAHAYRLCPQAIFVKPRFSVYREASQIIRAIFARYTELFEPLSLDEAYLDVSVSPYFRGSATLLAKEIKQQIQRQTQLIASAGVSYNKFLAKLASDLGKPDGLYLITPQQGETFVADLPVAKFHGVGRATEKKMLDLGVRFGRDLKRLSLAELQQHFGSSAQYFYDLARGIDRRPVRAHRVRKSVGIETTFEQDIADPSVITQHLRQLLQKVLLKLAENNLHAYTLTIKVKYQDFVQITRARTLPRPVGDSAETWRLIGDLLKSTEVGEKKVRLLGVTLSGLQASGSTLGYRQLDLFEPN